MNVLPTILIASPQMKDPSFERTVVLVWHYDEDGAIGVIINRILKHKIADVLEMETSVDLEALDTPVVWGGPVDSDSGTVVTGGPISDSEGWILPNGVGVTRSQDALMRLLETGAPTMLCLGYAGWGPGQLERELELGGWLWTDCDANIVFNVPVEDRYDHAIASLGIAEHMVWMHPVSE
mgnify:CR=1 FL=1